MGRASTLSLHERGQIKALSTAGYTVKRIADVLCYHFETHYIIYIYISGLTFETKMSSYGVSEFSNSGCLIVHLAISYESVTTKEFFANSLILNFSKRSLLFILAKLNIKKLPIK
uniref:HTH_38 domain-containing protein n=1 Tax=Heterorhabditis bacteriophora TaxID=37862 RepID=A0A1I7WVY4_HETBA